MAFTLNPKFRIKEDLEFNSEKTPQVGSHGPIADTNVVPGSTIPPVPLLPMNGPTDRGFGNEIISSDGADQLIGGAGSVFGFGGGNDPIIGGSSFEKLGGGMGIDIFSLTEGYGRDAARDFNFNEDSIIFGDVASLGFESDNSEIHKGDDLLTVINGCTDKEDLLNLI